MGVLADICIVSGGQTGADRAALDFALEHGMAHGGWCPKGRLAEDGSLAEKYQLEETPHRGYSQRTEWNIRDSDATVIFSRVSKLRGGTALTKKIARDLKKPLLHLSCEDLPTIEKVGQELLAWLEKHKVKRLNIAGPRASQEPQIYDFVLAVLRNTK